jgi:hypothetical protein
MHLLRVMLSALLIPLLITSCETFTPSLQIANSVDSKMGYIYGRFRQIDDSRVGRLLAGISIKETTTGKAYQIKFEESQQVIAIPVLEGTYLIDEVVFATWDHAKAGRKSVSPELRAPFRVDASTAAYIGDWVVETGVAPSSTSFNVLVQSWNVRLIGHDFAGATSDLNARFPAFIPFRKADAIQPITQ